MRRTHATWQIPSLVGACIVSWTLSAGAEEYTIQLGAFKTPSIEFTRAAQAVGKIYASDRDGGITALSVGRYDSQEAANTALSQINSTYPTAYVRIANADARLQATAPPGASMGVKREAIAKSNAAAQTPATEETVLDTEMLATLSDEERKHVVYLDGKLHFKTGDTFVPLAQYRAQQSQR